jgi:hypothetical protein
MLTNGLKKGARVRLANGWNAVIADNLKGNTRMATVYGYETEMGSVYSHDIVSYLNVEIGWCRIEHTPAQLKLKARIGASL